MRQLESIGMVPSNFFSVYDKTDLLDLAKGSQVPTLDPGTAKKRREMDSDISIE
jgi:hypothetical protein